MKKPNILFISYAFYPQLGGIEINAEILTQYFLQFGYPVRLITAVTESGEQTFPFPVFRNPNLKELIKLHKWADVVFENNPSLRLSWPRFFFSSGSVIAIRQRIDYTDGGLRLQDLLKLKILKRANEVIAVSSAIGDKNFPDSTVIGNPYRNYLFKNLNRDRKPLSFVFLGRLVSIKGVDIAIKAFSKFNERFAGGVDKPSLKIIGEGSEMLKLKNLVVQYGLENQVTFEGKKQGSDLVELLNTCRYILIPSRWEAFGNIALEAMACGCLPFVSDTGGLPEAAGPAGIQFKAGSAEALSLAMLNIIEHPKLEAEQRDKIPAHLEEHFPERVALKYLAVINKAHAVKNKIRR